jgi:hypothetical protein
MSLTITPVICAVPRSLIFVLNLSRRIYPDTFSGSSGRRYVYVEIGSLRDVGDIGRFLGYGKGHRFSLKATALICLQNGEYF